MSVFKSDPSSSEDESQEERVHFKMSNKRSFSYIDAEDSESEPKKMHRNGAFSSHKFISGHSADDGEDEILSFNRSMEFPSKAGDSIGSKLMRQMGWDGRGLGKDGKGRIEPVQASKQRGFRGLGFRIEELEKAHEKFNPEDEIVKVEEDIDWLINDLYEEPDIDDDWMTLGPSKLTIDDETEFCDPFTVSNVINSKSVFDRLDKLEMRDARTRSNPYETIRSAFFINRAAVKMANMDKACNFMFTRPDNLKSDELLYFADVCAGPGGFSEYVLYRKKWKAKGFGFTLRRENDFKIDDFTAGPCETFHPYYGPREDGDVFWPENQIALKKLVMRQTKGKGVHFMMSDGGFSVEGQENIQEILSKQLYLCQCLVALMIVRDGGHFVTKLFDLFTPFSAGLVFLMYRCFDEVSIFKPNTSRPANSERYLICKGKRPNTQRVLDYLFTVNTILQKRDKSKDVTHLVPLEILKTDNKFFDYLKVSNDEIGRRQIVGLLKIAHYAQEKTLIEERQADMRKLCLAHWELEDKMRSVPRKMKPHEKISKLLDGYLELLKKDFNSAKKFIQENIQNTVLNSPLDWYCMPCASTINATDEKKATFYLGLGRAQVFRFVQNVWERVDNVYLPADTLVYAEAVMEFRKTGRHQRKAERLHIIDGYMLGGENISKEYLLDRHRMLATFCEALWKPHGQECRIFMKDLHLVDEHLEDKLKLITCQMKTGPQADVYYPLRNSQDYNCEEDDNERSYFKPQSLLFMKVTADHWARHKSTKNDSIYIYDIKNRKSFYEFDRPASANATCVKTFNSMMVWDWPQCNTITMDFIMKYIRKALVKTNFST